MKPILNGTAVFFAIVIPLVLLHLNTVAGWHIDSWIIFPLKYYLINGMILLFLCSEALVCAFLAHRVKRPLLARILLASGSLICRHNPFPSPLAENRAGPQGSNLCLNCGKL